MAGETGGLMGRFRDRIRICALALWLVCAAGGGWAAPGASFVMDARTGQVYAAENADARRHPASLTKMMTLYLAFAAVERGRLAMEDVVRISARAALEPGSRLGLRAGERVTLRDLITATAVRSANDAATALAEAVAGSETAFVTRMNDAARRMGLRNTRFRNAHGLTAEGHYSTARDMSLLGRQLALDFPQFFELFRQRKAQAAGREILHTNRRFLGAYAGADGIKTGYTSAAGYNLTASARRSGKRLIVTVMGAGSSAERSARVSRLMDAGFAKAPEQAEPPSPRAAPRPLLADRAPLFTAAANGAVTDASPPRGAGSVGVFALR
ncbi:D-alanyl-D-alanine carboxypeptidase family protein [Salipiger abyssi]|uniref:D-alanyl-D-alanine carboxypeptidase family protein n=2 Tax=Salipiger abyssi TaxID=1250539 RepID=UPI00405968D6